jgi:hypothetical protein
MKQIGTIMLMTTASQTGTVSLTVYGKLPSCQYSDALGMLQRGARGVNIRDVAVVQGERPHVWSDVPENVADGSKGGEDGPVEDIGERHDP